MNYNDFFNGKTILVTGGAGFIGSHLVDRLVETGAFVVVVDNFVTGHRTNIQNSLETGQARLIEADASLPPDDYLVMETVIDGIFHLASPASPKKYGQYPVETYKINSFGTHYLAEYAHHHGIPMLFSSTSECYGDPLEHPQKETYWGNVNPIGIRSCYDESKRFGETVMSTWHREHGLDARLVRIFNTYGPRMSVADGRITPNFILQALRNEPMTVYGDGSQTRSLCFVDDLVEMILRAYVTPEAKGEVINIGNPYELTVLEIAQKIKNLTGSSSEIVYENLPVDDPARRRPDITKAQTILGYEPQTGLDEGLQKTIAWFKNS